MNGNTFNRVVELALFLHTQGCTMSMLELGLFLNRNKLTTGYGTPYVLDGPGRRGIYRMVSRVAQRLHKEGRPDDAEAVALRLRGNERTGLDLPSQSNAIPL